VDSIPTAGLRGVLVTDFGGDLFLCKCIYGELGIAASRRVGLRLRFGTGWFLVPVLEDGGDFIQRGYTLRLRELRG